MVEIEQVLLIVTVVTYKKIPWTPITNPFFVLISFKFYFRHKYSSWGYEPQQCDNLP